MAYEVITPTFIENTRIEKYVNGAGLFKAYFITPIEGYLIHDKEADTIDENGDTVKGYTSGTVTCGYNYDFETNPREFYTVAADERS